MTTRNIMLLALAERGSCGGARRHARILPPACALPAPSPLAQHCPLPRQRAQTRPPAPHLPTQIVLPCLLAALQLLPFMAPSAHMLTSVLLCLLAAALVSLLLRWLRGAHGCKRACLQAATEVRALCTYSLHPATAQRALGTAHLRLQAAFAAGVAASCCSWAAPLCNP